MPNYAFGRKVAIMQVRRKQLDTILQLLGSAAIVQFVSRSSYMQRHDRKQTLQQVDEFLNTKLAPKELVDDVKQIGVALLPTSTTSKALPAPTEAKPEPKVEPAAAKSPQVKSVPQTKVEPTTSKTTLSPTEAKPEPKVEATAVTPLINSVPKTESKADGNFRFPRPLSPYSCYPYLKQPTSPTPSEP
ncbi:rhodanese-like domain-containing protein 4, chloroplastic [Hibiscus syriacus]|uniref:rhodanese-like domain-containing protein 4, chloroplastic n=1 Tax=Hibiscus syriacus TaxID=106335 RepID=UPI0019213190|nr:rhodanese-like domain-containing protein 4, chloroplastic [Hibiscus syriacus]